MIEVRKLPAERWKDYRDLRLEALKSDPLAFSSSTEEAEKYTEEEWKRGIQNVLFALSNDDPIGQIVYVLNDRRKTNHIAEIFGFYVSPPHRGKGVGTELLRTALSLIRENKEIIKVKLSVNPEQRAAVKLYEKAGFVVAGRMKKELRVGREFFDELVMEKLF